MRHRITFGGTILAVALLLLTWAVPWSRPLSAMEQTAEAVRNVKSFQYDCVWERGSQHSKIYCSDGHLRSEMSFGNRIRWVKVVFPNKSRLSIDYKWKTYSHTKARKGPLLLFDFVTALMKVSGEANQDLGPKRIGSIEARGFRIASERLDPNGSGGTSTVWVDPHSKLPILVEFERDSTRTHHLENFRWNVALSPELFDLQPPADYIDVTPAPSGSNKQLADIIAALRTYAQASDGHYPPITRSYRDVGTLATRLEKKLGIPSDFESSEAATQHEAYPRYRKAELGFEAIYSIQRDNFNFGYFGETVGPTDASKVLMHWECDVGVYRVIYGDLKSEIITETDLRSLLQRK